MNYFRRVSILLLSLCLLCCAILTSCSDTSIKYTNHMVASDVSQKLLAALPNGGNSFRRVDEDYISESHFGERYEELLSRCYDGSVILTAEDVSTSADQLGIFHATSEENTREVKAILEEFVISEGRKLKDQYAQYAVDEVPKLENGQVIVCGYYVMYTFLSDEDTKTAQATFDEVLRTS